MLPGFLARNCPKPQTTYWNIFPKELILSGAKHLDYINGSILDIDTQGFSHSNLDEEDYLIHAMNISSEALYYLKASCVPETRTIYIRTKKASP